MTVQVGLYQTRSETTLLVFPRGGSFIDCMNDDIAAVTMTQNDACVHQLKSLKAECQEKGAPDYVLEGLEKTLNILKVSWSSKRTTFPCNIHTTLYPTFI